MIDWVTAVIPSRNSGNLGGNWITEISSEGEEIYNSRRPLVTRGSHEATIRIKSNSHDEIWFDGNPIKFLQGHNIFGTDDLVGVMELVLLELTKRGILNPTDIDRQKWKKGDYSLTHVDVNYGYHQKTRKEVLAWIRGAGDHANLKHRGQGQFKEDTLYFGKNSRRWAFKMYSKGQEIQAPKHKLPSALSKTKLSDYAEALLRIELVLRSLELKRIGLERAESWEISTPENIFKQKLSMLDLSQNYRFTNKEVDNLPSRLRLTYQSWLDGHDLRSMLSRPTFYRHRSELMKFGIDISIIQKQDGSMSNVVPLIRALEVAPAVIPDWAVGTNLYIEPRSIK